MNLKEKIVVQLPYSMKKGDKVRTETLRMLKAQILEFEKKGADQKLTEADELAILNISVKKRKEAIELYEKGNRQELAEQEKAELKIIFEFMPPQLSESVATEIIKKIISELGATDDKDFPKVISKAMPELKGKIDGKVVTTIIKNLLSGAK